MASLMDLIYTAVSKTVNMFTTGESAYITEPFTSVNVKRGVQYEFTNFEQSFAAQGVSDFLIVTGSKPVLIKALDYQCDGLGLKTQVFKSPTLTSNGTLVSDTEVYGCNDVTKVPHTVMIYVNPVVTLTGDQLFATKYVLGSTDVGANVDTTYESNVDGLEYGLAPNSMYLFRRTSLDASSPQRVAAYATWYEGIFSING